MSTCGFEERLAAYASGGAGGGSSEGNDGDDGDDELTAHLPSCASCRAELEATRALLRQLAPLVESARSPGRADAQGELFWADFTRGVRAQLDAGADASERQGGARAPVRARARRAWIAAPALCAAAALVWFVAGRELARPTPGLTAVAPSPVVARALREDPADDLIAGDGSTEAAAEVEAEPDPAGRVAELDDDQLDQVLAQLVAADAAAADDSPGDRTDDPRDDVPDVDPYDTLESLDDDQLDAVDATL